ncbi:MAG TPA: ribose 5-phosphate isomerase A [Acidimicrobiales bacterium]|nr:ribose 5-phosphate isomerase A [Acidimicrobiales bacterium]
MSVGVEEEKRLAARAAAEMVEDGMRVGLGSGTTVAFLLEAIARRAPRAVFVASSPRTHVAARGFGLNVQPFDVIESLDLAIDGADQIAPDGWLIKGGGGAHTREKIVAATAKRFVVIADATKLVDALHAPVPLELSSFGLAATLRRLETCEVRDWPASPDGGVIADYRGRVDVPEELARRLSSTPGVVAHGLFAPEMVSELCVGVRDTVRHTIIGGTS